MLRPMIERLRDAMSRLVGGHRGDMEMRFSDETRFHIEMATAQYIRDGMSTDDAHRAALLQRIAGQDVSRQVLLVTHHAKEDVVGLRIELVRRDKSIGGRRWRGHERRRFGARGSGDE